MQPFTFIRTKNNIEAINAVSGKNYGKFIGGGTNLIDLVKYGVENPSTIVDINSLDLSGIQKLPNGNIIIGALVRNTDLAYDPVIRNNYPVLSEAVLSGASAQLRNMATTAGNLLQRTRCQYFYDTAFPCNKRVPGSGCSAMNGFNRIHAILGTSEKCIATHPSDMAVAMMALDVIIHVQNAKNIRSIPISKFYRTPEDKPELEHVLQQDDLITSVEIPSLPFATRSTYLKVRNRASYDFALASAAVILDMNNGVVNNARIALGGVGTIPWRSPEAESVLKGATASKTSFEAAAVAALKNSKTRKYNAFKPELARRTLVRALTIAGGLS